MKRATARLVFSRVIALFGGFGFRDVFTFLGLAVVNRAFLVIKMRQVIYPNETVSAAGHRRCRSGSSRSLVRAGLGVRFLMRTMFRR